MKHLENTIKIALAILLFLCLLEMPYGYYQLVRVIATIGFGILAYQNYIRKNETNAVICLGLCILFQPIVKIALGRQLWNIVDVIVAIGLIVSIVYTSRKRNN